jgi:hypothetical protein
MENVHKSLEEQRRRGRRINKSVVQHWQTVT